MMRKIVTKRHRVKRKDSGNVLKVENRHLMHSVAFSSNNPD